MLEATHLQGNFYSLHDGFPSICQDRDDMLRHQILSVLSNYSPVLQHNTVFFISSSFRSFHQRYVCLHSIFIFLCIYLNIFYRILATLVWSCLHINIHVFYSVCRYCIDVSVCRYCIDASVSFAVGSWVLHVFSSEDVILKLQVIRLWLVLKVQNTLLVEASLGKLTIPFPF